MKPRIVSAAATLVLYAGLVVWLTWPLAGHIATRLPFIWGSSRFDPLYMAWVLAHESRTLATAPSQLLDTNIYYPARGTLFYGDAGFGALPYFMPTFLLTGNPALALNLVFLSGIALTAWSLHLVVARWTGSHVAGFIAAWTFLATRWVLWEFVPTAPSYAVLQYWPWIVLLAALPARNFAGALRLLPLVILQCLTDLVYVAPAVLGPLGVLALARVARRTTREAGLRLLAVLTFAVIALSPLYAGHFRVAAEGPRLLEETYWSTALSRLSHRWAPFDTGPMTVQVSTVLLILLGGVSFLVSRRDRSAEVGRAWAHGVFWSVGGLLISLPPMVYWHGQAIRLPLGLLAEQVPIVQVLRQPERLGVATLVGMALLAGLAFAECARRLYGGEARVPAFIGRTILAVLVAGAMYAQYSRGLGTLRTRGNAPLPRAYPLGRTIPPDAPLMQILRMPGGPLLEWPVGNRGEVVTPVFHARAMYRSIFHQRRLLNGYDSYWPAGFPERMALADRLPDPEALAALRRETGLELVLVVAPERRFDNADRTAWFALAERGGRADLRLIARDGDNLLFAVAAEGLPDHRGQPVAPERP